MRFYLDTEFNGFGGTLISLAIVGEDDSFIYLVNPDFLLDKRMPLITSSMECVDSWVADNVLPILSDTPEHVIPRVEYLSGWGAIISDFLYRNDGVPQVFVDWPEDLRYLCELLLTGPGESVRMEHQTHFTILRGFDAYPTSLPGAVQHNAWWDAMALRQWVREASNG